MVESVLNNITLYEKPYPIMASPSCLSAGYYKALADLRPDPEYITDSDANNKRYDKGALDILNDDSMPKIWKEFVEYHTSQAFWHEWIMRMGDYTRFYYPWLEWAFKKKLENLKAGIRGTRDADVYLDCQLSINTPCKEKSKVIGAHIDNPSELYGSLLYMRAEEDDSLGGEFEVYKCKSVPRVTGKRLIDNAERASIYPYKANNYIGFLNTPYSVHGVSEREITKHPRLMVNISIELCDRKLFNPEIYRKHK